eukprot:scaffold51199_cov17-Prasinocladus_malaysianus.AAC.1
MSNAENHKECVRSSEPCFQVAYPWPTCAIAQRGNDGFRTQLVVPYGQLVHHDAPNVRQRIRCDVSLGILPPVPSRLHGPSRFVA